MIIPLTTNYTRELGTLRSFFKKVICVANILKILRISENWIRCKERMKERREEWKKNTGRRRRRKECWASDKKPVVGAASISQRAIAHDLWPARLGA